jgi:putative transposase
MTSYKQVYYHIVFRTKRSKKSIPNQVSKELYNYIWGIIKNKGCKLFQINGVEDHLHLLTDLHSSLALADFIREIKVSSNKWMKESGKFPDFDGWAEGYGAFTCSSLGKSSLIGYIKKQKEHHQIMCFSQEFRKLLEENGIQIDDRYFLNDQ